MVTPKLNLNASVASKEANRYIFGDIWHINAAWFASKKKYVEDFVAKMLRITEVTSV